MILILLLCGLLLLPTGSAGARSFLKAGTAAFEITAPAGHPFRNFPIRSEAGRVTGPRISEGTNDPMMAKALVLQEGSVTVALVALDLSRFKRAEIEKVIQNQ